MPRRRAKKLDFTFVAGLITEASPLTFPQNSSRDEENFVLLRDGRRRRRKGIEHEDSPGFPFIPASGYQLAGGNIASAERDWLNADGQSTADFTVVQTGRYLTFWRKQTPFLGNNLPNIVDLLSFAAPNASEQEIEEGHVEMAAGNGRLYVTGAFVRPFYIEFIPGDPAIPTFDTITTTALDLRERDFTDIDEGVSNTQRPTVLSPAHEYNLKNSGWTDGLINQVFTDRGNYPALNETPYEGYLVDPATGKDIFDTDHLTAQLFGDSRSPRGHFIRDPFCTTQASTTGDFGAENPITSVSYVSGTTWRIVTQNPHGLTVSDTFSTDGNVIFCQQSSGPIEPIDRSFDDHTNTVTNVLSALSFEFTTGFGVPAGFNCTVFRNGTIVPPGTIVTNPDGYKSNVRPRAVAFYTGRVWYAGTPNPNLSTKVFFSQIVEQPEDAEKCYQQADPTSEHISDLVATDGGVINIPDIGEVYRMEPIWDSLLLFTDNGIWQIRGGNNVFFSPNNYLVRKVSNLEVRSPESVVVAEGSPIVWADEGIYLLQQGERGAIGTLSLTEQSIQSLYQDIPDACKHRASGEYDDITKRVVWTYSSDASNPGLHDLQLWFDARLKAWYKFRLPRAGDNVTDNIIGVARTEEHDQQENPLRFLTITTNAQDRITWSDFTEEDFIDWPLGEDPLDAAAFLETGFDVQSDPTIDKAQNLVFTYMERTDADNPSSCRFSTLWDWAYDGEFGNQTRRVEIYKEGMQRNAGNRVVVARNKVRGKGRAYHMRFETRPERDCVLIGWGVQVSGETDN